jgi:acetyl esterase/lipase
MMLIIQAAAFLCFFISSITIIHPRAGWSRLVLFVPKLFSGSFILFSGLFGGGAAVAGWLIGRDVFSLIFGCAALFISARHVYRLLERALRLRKHFEEIRPLPGTPESMRRAPSILGYALTTPKAYTWEKDVQIGTHVENGGKILADVWSPSRETGHSGLGVVYLHGSGWHYADKDFCTRPFFRYLTAQGHLIVDVAYTLAPAADIFGMLADVKRSICWMKDHSADLHIKADRIVLMGGSAGGHLALLAAYTPNHPELDPPDVCLDTSVRAVVSYYGPPDLKAQFRSFAELPGLTGKSGIERTFMEFLESRFGFEVIPVHRLLPEALGGEPSTIPDVYESASPCHHIGKHCPPTLLLQGLHDFSGAAPEVRSLHRTLLAAGRPSYLLELPDTEHGFDLYKPKLSPAAIAATYVAARFLESLV